MTKFDGVTKGPVTLTADTDVRGIINGDVTIVDGSRLALYGTIAGDLKIEQGCEALIYGTVSGAVQNNGSVYVAGMVLRGIYDTDSAQTNIDAKAVVLARGKMAAWF